MLLVAAPVCAAEFEAPRISSVSSVEKHIFKAIFCIKLRQLTEFRAIKPSCFMEAGASIPQLPPSEFFKL